MSKIFEKWYYSTLRFYIKNLLWNYLFWLKAKKIYKYENFKLKDQNGFYTGQSKNIKKFIGFEFQNKIYLDNPGFPITDRKLWKIWRNKGLIK